MIAAREKAIVSAWMKCMMCGMLEMLECLLWKAWKANVRAGLGEGVVA